MKKLALLSFAVLIALCGFAQIENPVKWSTKYVKTGDKSIDVILTAIIAPGWHLYSQDAGEGPQPTTIAFSKNPLIKEDESTKESGKLIKQFDPNFNSVLKYYAGQAVFTQRFKLKSTTSTVAKGTVTYMVCNDSKCLPPKTVPFSVQVSGK